MDIFANLKSQIFSTIYLKRKLSTNQLYTYINYIVLLTVGAKNAHTLFTFHTAQKL